MDHTITVKETSIDRRIWTALWIFRLAGGGEQS